MSPAFAAGATILDALAADTGLHEGATPGDVHAAITHSKPLARGVLEGRYGR